MSKSIDFTNTFAQAYIPSGGPVFIELPRDFKSDGGQCDVVISKKKSLYGKAKDARLWYERLQNGLLYSGFVVNKVYLCTFMSKTAIYVVYVDYCLFWARSKYDIYIILKSFKDDVPSYNW